MIDFGVNWDKMVALCEKYCIYHLFFFFEGLKYISIASLYNLYSLSYFNIVFNT